MPDDPRTLTLASWGRVFQTKAHQYQITGCCLSPDRRLLATVCLGGYLKVTKSELNHEPKLILLLDVA